MAISPKILTRVLYVNNENLHEKKVEKKWA